MGGDNGRNRGRGAWGRRSRGAHRGQRWTGNFRGQRGGGRGRGAQRPPGTGDSHNEKFPLAVGPRLAEVDAGITEFIGKHEGFSAVMKQRYSDFQVNEIDCDGNVVKLTSLDVPPKETDDSAEVKRHELIPEEIWDKLSCMVKNTDKPPVASVSSNNKVPESGGKQVVEIGSENASHSLSAKPDSASENNPNSAPDLAACEAPVANKATEYVELDVTTLDKDSRRAIHKSVKGAFKQLNSNTTERNGKKYVVFSLAQGARENRGKWPSSRAGEYLQFVVHKRNMDTNEIVNIISQKLWLKPNKVTFAGTKDKRGITSQLMSLRRVEPFRVFNLSRGVPGLFLGNYCFKEKPLRLGSLKGNQFRIALRNLQGSDEEIKAGLESLKNYGFINYYGLQRFGTNKAVPTHTVGRALLLGDWQKAIDLILEPRESSPATVAALKEWKSSRNAEAALKKLNGRSNGLEELLLMGLVRYNQNDLVNALAMLPLNTRLMYLHAYQSLIWNKTVSQRIREFGLKPIAGDLILIKSENVTEVESSGAADDPITLDSNEVDLAERSTRQEVKCITEEEINNFTIEDIVLPLPGYDVVFPNNTIGSFMKDLLKEDGLTSESLHQQVRTYSIKGAYRHIVARADKLTWDIVTYNDPEADLIASDFDQMKGKKIANVEGGKYKALVICMCLESSTYATMAVREITRKDTSATTQAMMAAAAASSTEETGSDSSVSEKAVHSVADDVPSSSTEDSKNTSIGSTSGSNEEAMQVSDDANASSNAQTSETIVEETKEGVSGLKRKGDAPLDDTVAEKKMKEL